MPKVAKNKIASPLEEAAPQPMDFESGTSLAGLAGSTDAQDVKQPETDAGPLQPAKFPPISAFEQNGKKLEFRRVCLLLKKEPRAHTTLISISFRQLLRIIGSGLQNAVLRGLGL